MTHQQHDHSGGIGVADLDDDTLRKELASIHRTRHDTFLHAKQDALAKHTERMRSLEQEYLRRFPDREINRGRERDLSAD